MSITQALSNAYTGLSASSQRASVASGNIANATTPGYARREVLVGERVVAGQGAGVTVNGIGRAENAALTSERRQSDAAIARSEALSEAYGTLNRALGEPDDGFGLFADYEEFENAIRDLAVTPESGALQSRAVSAANSVAANLNNLSQLSEQLRTDADTEINALVAGVNENLQRIEDLNGDIASSSGSGGDTAALIDERQRLVDAVAEVIPVREYNRDGGTIDLVTNEGVFLLAGSAKTIEFTQSGITGPGTTFEDGQLSGLSVDGVDITPGGDSAVAVQTGRLAGLFAIRDEVGTSFTAQLDALAGDLVSRFGDDALDPTKAPGDPGLFTDNGNAFDPVASVGIAGRIEINAAVDPNQGGEIRRIRDGLGSTTEGASGDATIPEGLLAAFTDKQTAPAGTGLFGSLSSVENVAGILSSIGESRVRADSIQAAASARGEILSNAELAQTAVDTDQEIQSLLLIEQAYAANARVIQTVSQMIDTLLAI